MKAIMVDLITALVVEKVPKLSGRDYVEYVAHSGVPRHATHVSNSDHVLLTERFYRKVAPIAQICFGQDARPDLYVAYSEEVERLLGVPIRAIRARADAADAESAGLRGSLLKIEAMGFLHRLRFAFTGGLT